MNRPTKLLAALAAATIMVAGCGYEETPLPEPEAAPSTEEPAEPRCTPKPGDGDLASFAPDSTPGQTVRAIQEHGALVVGVSADTYLMSSTNPEANNRFEGFDVEIVKAIGKAIFGSSFDAGKNIQYKVITAATRIKLLMDGDVDMVVRNFTINCDRWIDIAFSQVYYNATQKVLVRKDIPYSDITDLAGLRVCAPTGSTSLTNITDAEPEAEVVPAPNHTGCLVKLQNGDVDAITGDDTVLAGLAAQDPYAVVPEEQPEFSDEPYGVGVSKGEEDFAAFINAVLEDMRDSGAWDRAYRDWLQPYLGSAADGATGATQPAPVTPYRQMP